MAGGIDTSMYSNINQLDILGGLRQGMQLRGQMDQRAQAEAEREEQSQLAEAQKASMVVGPDGKFMIDQNKLGSNIMALAGRGNRLAANAGMTLGQNMTQQQREQEKWQNTLRQQERENSLKQTQLDQGQQRALWDREAQLANIGKTRAETSELLRKPNEPVEIKTNQATAAGFGRRLEQAESVFDSLVKGGYDRSDIASAAESSLPNWAKGKKSQQQDQAERNFVNAVLRRESGAAISPTEFESATIQYFPRAGDSPEVLAQKKANRQQAGLALKAEAGKAWGQIPLAVPKYEPKPSDPPEGRTVEGYRFKGGDPSKQENWEKV